jgi:hypothetical protein
MRDRYRQFGTVHKPLGTIIYTVDGLVASSQLDYLTNFHVATPLALLVLLGIDVPPSNALGHWSCATQSRSEDIEQQTLCGLYETTRPLVQAGIGLSVLASSYWDRTTSS